MRLRKRQGHVAVDFRKLGLVQHAARSALSQTAARPSGRGNSSASTPSVQLPGDAAMLQGHSPPPANHAPWLRAPPWQSCLPAWGGPGNRRRNTRGTGPSREPRKCTRVLQPQPFEPADGTWMRPGFQPPPTGHPTAIGQGLQQRVEPLACVVIGNKEHPFAILRQTKLLARHGAHPRPPAGWCPGVMTDKNAATYAG